MGARVRRKSRLPLERMLGADVSRLTGVLAVLAGTAASAGGSWGAAAGITLIAATAATAERLLGERWTTFAVLEALAVVVLVVAHPGPAPADLYLLVPPLAAGLSNGVRSAVQVWAAQTVLVCLALARDPSAAALSMVIVILIGLLLGIVGSLVGRAVHRAVQTVAARAAQVERRRLSAEIHDGLAQDLAVLAHRLDQMVITDPRAVPADAVEAVADDIRRTLHDTRWAIHDLRDGRLPEVGFGTALADHVRRAADISGLTAHLSITEGNVKLPVASQTELLRIAQESVANVRKHARADNLWVTLELSGRNALLVVADDGADAPALTAEQQSECFGLRIMRERAERIGADLTYRARAGRGTVVEVVLRDESFRMPTAALARLLRKTDQRGDREMHALYEGMPKWA